METVCKLVKPIGHFLRVCFYDEQGQFECEDKYKYGLDATLDNTPSLSELSIKLGTRVVSKGIIPRFDSEDGRLKPGWMYFRETDNHLIVLLPFGMEWDIDGPSRNCHNPPCWTRTGNAPNITAHPSIDDGVYHGWLKNGILTENLYK